MRILKLHFGNQVDYVTLDTLWAWLADNTRFLIPSTDNKSGRGRVLSFEYDYKNTTSIQNAVVQYAVPVTDCNWEHCSMNGGEEHTNSDYIVEECRTEANQVYVGVTVIDLWESDKY